MLQYSGWEHFGLLVTSRPGEKTGVDRECQMGKGTVIRVSGEIDTPREGSSD